MSGSSGMGTNLHGVRLRLQARAERGAFSSGEGRKWSEREVAFLSRLAFGMCRVFNELRRILIFELSRLAFCSPIGRARGGTTQTWYLNEPGRGVVGCDYPPRGVGPFFHPLLGYTEVLLRSWDCRKVPRAHAVRSRDADPQRIGTEALLRLWDCRKVPRAHAVRSRDADPRRIGTGGSGYGGR
jgi:hypothetical protein